MRTRKMFLFVMALPLAIGLALPAQAAPKRGGIVNWFVYADPTRFDTHAESPLSVQQATAGIYSSLLQHDPLHPGKIIPDLATSYKASGGGTVFTFQLRKGVKWHDGKPFTSKDVVYSFKRVTKKGFRSPRCGTLMRPLLKNVEAVGKLSVKFTLKFPAGTFIPSVASAWCRILPEHIGRRDGDFKKAKSLIGTGPFKFKRYRRGSIMEWVRNPNYFIKGLPYVDGVKQFILKGKATQLAAAKAGRVMLWDTWPPMSKSMARELEKAQGNKIKTYKASLNTVYVVYLNQKRKPFDNPDIRRAARLAINRQQIIEKAFEGAGLPCNLLDTSLYGKFALPQSEALKSPGCNPATKKKDIETAKKLIKKHYPNGVSIEVAVRSVGNYVDRTQLLIQQLRKVGFKIRFKTYESAVGFRNWGRGNFTLIGSQDTAMIMSDPHGMFALVYSADGGRNYARWKDPKIDEMIDRGLKELDTGKRVKIYHELQRYIHSKADMPTIVMGWVEGYFFESKKLKNYKRATTVYDNNTFQSVWVDR